MVGFTLFKTDKHSVLTYDCIGMFLYARLICDTLEHFYDLDDIKEEVTTLPDGLSEA